MILRGARRQHTTRAAILGWSRFHGAPVRRHSQPVDLLLAYRFEFVPLRLQVEFDTIGPRARRPAPRAAQLRQLRAGRHCARSDPPRAAVQGTRAGAATSVPSGGLRLEADEPAWGIPLPARRQLARGCHSRSRGLWRSKAARARSSAGAGAVAADHLAALPAGQAHQVAFLHAIGEQRVREAVAEGVRVGRDAGLARRGASPPGRCRRR